MDRLVGLGGGLMARTNPSLAEALSPWSAPHDAADLWAQGQISVFRRKAAQSGQTAPSQASMQSKLNLF